MRWRSVSALIPAAALLAAATIAGCDEDAFIVMDDGNSRPVVELTSGPVEGDTTEYRVHFYWFGHDRDGVIDRFEYVMADGDPLGFDPVDTTGPGAWTATAEHDLLVTVTADEEAGAYEDNPTYTLCRRTHTFFLRAVDDRGAQSEISLRSFTAQTIAPFAIITYPPVEMTVSPQHACFEWIAYDPISVPYHTQNPESIRHLCLPSIDEAGGYVDHIAGLNERPEDYEAIWSPWYPYGAPGEAGRKAVYGPLALDTLHCFAVQARDEAGAVTSVFIKGSNAREFTPVENAPLRTPYLVVWEPFLGVFGFGGAGGCWDYGSMLPPGVPLHFCWTADASDYGGEITGYRYGWDIADLEDPSQWEVEFGLFNRCAPERTLHAGEHTLYVQARDDANNISTACIVIEVMLSFTMERNLLVVDDWPSTDDPYPASYDYSWVRESEHDAFWAGIAGRAAGFDPNLDVYDCAENNNEPPGIELVAHYKNIIWIYAQTNTSWEEVVSFVCESQPAFGWEPRNFLPLFLNKGGHLWTLGRADRTGGLSETFFEQPLFPVAFDEMCGDYADPADSSWKYSMGYRDYCVDVIDKVRGLFRTDLEFGRDPMRDGLRNAYRDDSDPVTLGYPELPADLTLHPEITGPTGFARVELGGFPYVEIYDPEYWMAYTIRASRDCFHPIYRMRALNTLSPLHHTTVAIWITRYADVVPEVEGGPAVAAPSVHLGFPLWFFDHGQAEQLADVIFTEWGISAQ